MSEDKLLSDAQKQIESVEDLRSLEELRVSYLGKSGAVSALMKDLSKLPPEERREFGQKVNKLKVEITQLVVDKKANLERKALNARLIDEKLDMSLPARPSVSGSIHPTSRAIEEITNILLNRGFQVAEGPNLEDDWYNFTALNIDENHPARQMHDTFYMNSVGTKDGREMLLRTHTSPIQIRAMQNTKPPYRFIAPGRTYRCDSDMTHTPMFHQIEGLWIDKGVNMGHLKYIVQELICEFFENDEIDFLFRPSFFPFTEPSAEIDIRMNKDSKWLEVMGCGMVHPKVLEAAGVDSSEYQGFAFGLGVERFAMLKYNIKDLRQFFEGDMRWLKHYNFSSFDIPSLIGGLSR